MINILNYKYQISYKLQKYIPFIIAMPVLAEVQFCSYFNVIEKYDPNSESKYTLQVIDEKANISNLIFTDYEFERVNLHVINNVSFKKDVPCITYYNDYILYINHNVVFKFYYMETSYDYKNVYYSLQSYEVMNLDDFILSKDIYNKFLSISILYKFL